MQNSPKFSKTHNAILDAAVCCYGKLGIEKTAMVDIAAEANIGRTTLYRHFKSQDDILIEAVVPPNEPFTVQPRASWWISFSVAAR